MFRGLTWDHPRGRNALERAAAQSTAGGRPVIGWDTQPLEGFESAPIEELAARYDVIVVDHPHLGDALSFSALQPLDDLFDAEFLAELEAGCVGPSFDSYRMDGWLWALPLDAATQVSVRVPELLERAPATWDEVDELEVPTAICLAGPHALMNFYSLCVGLGHEPSLQPGQGLVDPEIGAAAYQRLARIVSGMPDEVGRLNPIGLLQRMREERDFGYLPLVYGYVNYSIGEQPLIFDDVPRVGSGGRFGSTIGGTGIAISRRCEPDQALLDHLAWLLSAPAQTTFIPENDGQPSLRRAWDDDQVNDASAGFYRNTLATIEDSWIRPRFPGYIPFQIAASEVLRNALLAGDSAKPAVSAVNQLFDQLPRDAEGL